MDAFYIYLFMSLPLLSPIYLPCFALPPQTVLYGRLQQSNFNFSIIKYVELKHFSPSVSDRQSSGIGEAEF